MQDDSAPNREPLASPGGNASGVAHLQAGIALLLTPMLLCSSGHRPGALNYSCEMAHASFSEHRAEPVDADFVKIRMVTP